MNRAAFRPKEASGAKSTSRAGPRRPPRKRLLDRPEAGGLLIAIAIAAGLISSLLLNRLIANQLWGLKPHDPLTMATVIAIILVIGALACIVPAKRARHVEPLGSLRYE